MRANSKKSAGWAIVLIVLGLVALFAGEKALVVLIPAALLVLIGARPALRTGRN